jgi:hypothetical protein
VRLYLEKPFIEKVSWSGSRCRPWVQASVLQKQNKTKHMLSKEARHKMWHTELVVPVFRNWRQKMVSSRPAPAKLVRPYLKNKIKKVLRRTGGIRQVQYAC